MKSSFYRNKNKKGDKKMSTQNISIQANVPLDGFNQLKEILSSIKDGFKEILEPIKEISGILKEAFKSLIQQCKEKRRPLNPL